MLIITETFDTSSAKATAGLLRKGDTASAPCWCCAILIDRPMETRKLERSAEVTLAGRRFQREERPWRS